MAMLTIADCVNDAQMHFAGAGGTPPVGSGRMCMVCAGWLGLGRAVESLDKARRGLVPRGDGVSVWQRDEY